jgi:hypothetical protein
MNTYLRELESIDNLNLLIIGQDPYRDKKEQLDIAFCMSSFKKLFDNGYKDRHTSGKYVLNSLGYEKDDSRMEGFVNPESFFYSLLREEKIGFINISPNPLIKCEGTRKRALLNINNSKIRAGIDTNSDIISRLLIKTKKVVVIGTLSKIIFRETVDFKYKGFLRRLLKHPPANVSFLIHPSEKSKEKQQWIKEWSDGKRKLENKLKTLE